MNPLKIWFASSEVDPFVKTGGLADVAGSLPKALKHLGVDIRVVMPRYAQIDEKIKQRMTFLGSVDVSLTWRQQYCGVFSLEENDITYYFLDSEFYFKRDWYYGQWDDGERFAFFSRAVLDVLPLIGFQPDIIHCNDWQVGLIPLFLDAHYRYYRNDGFYRNMHTVFTIHNLRYQGIFSKEMMDKVLGLSFEYFHPDGIEFNGAVSFMKAGLNYASRITTVSKTYAEEIQGDYFGENLNHTINRRAGDLRGIVNGIDYDQNNPETDKRLHATFSKNDLTGKAEDKTALQKKVHLPVCPDVPLIGVISRLVAQKGFDLFARMLDELLQEDIQLLVLGSGDAEYEDLFRYAHARYPKKVAVQIKYDALLAQQIYAGADMFLMPSLFEPCGLSQLFSMRYGTVPIVRETGGLKDTVIPYNAMMNEGTGFTFANYNAHEMKDAVLRAVACYREPAKWHKMVVRCMSQDFSWKHAANEYLELYTEIVGKPVKAVAIKSSAIHETGGEPEKARTIKSIVVHETGGEPEKARTIKSNVVHETGGEPEMATAIISKVVHETGEKPLMGKKNENDAYVEEYEAEAKVAFQNSNAVAASPSAKTAGGKKSRGRDR